MIEIISSLKLFALIGLKKIMCNSGMGFNNMTHLVKSIRFIQLLVIFTFITFYFTATTIAQVPPTPTPTPVEICDNEQDDDGDGLVDCFDGDCATDPACLPTPVEICDNGIDDDGDGSADCDDADCATDPACLPTPESCDDDFFSDREQRLCNKYCEMLECDGEIPEQQIFRRLLCHFLEHRFIRKTGFEPPCELVAASCDDLVTEIDVWGQPAKGVDLRAYTNSTLHWIGCPMNGCDPEDFFCNYDEVTETLSFGSSGGSSDQDAMRAVVDPGDAFGDAMPTSFTNCCSAGIPFNICNAPDANNNGVPIDAAQALCDALGYQNGSLTWVNTNLCPEPNAITADGSDWTSDFSISSGYGKTYTCTGFK